MKYYQNCEDIVFCGNKEIAKELMDYFVKKGHKVLLSSKEILTGTHGSHEVSELFIYTKKEEI